MEILDASIALKWVLIETDSDRARQLREDFRNGIREFLAPDIFAVECAHALTKGERRGLIVDPDFLYDEIMLDAPRFSASMPLMMRVISIARKARIAVYDCVYVALAEREGCELITADLRVLNALQASFPFVKSLPSV
jgi:predicted nucleic acid-binding protein